MVVARQIMEEFSGYEYFCKTATSIADLVTVDSQLLRKVTLLIHQL